MSAYRSVEETTADARISYGVPLAPMTTLGFGGPASVVFHLRDPADFPEFVRLAHAWPGSPVCLGSGSNVLASDLGCPSPVLRLDTRGVRLTGETADGRVLVEVQAGHPLADLVEFTIDTGLSGMELLVGIPGTAGATPVQNVGAYGQEVSDTLVEVRAWDWVLERYVTLDTRECGLGHRTSVFKRSRRFTLLSLVFALHRSTLSAPIAYSAVAEQLGIPVGGKVPLAEAAQAVLAVRRRKGMVVGCAEADRRSAGSVFLSPEVDPGDARRLRARNAPVNSFPDGSTRVSASWLIQQAGFELNSPIVEGVRISSLHYTLVADEGSSAAAFSDAIGIVRQRVLRCSGVRLTPEVDFIGAWSPVEG